MYEWSLFYLCMHMFGDSATLDSRGRAARLWMMTTSAQSTRNNKKIQSSPQPKVWIEVIN